MATATPWHQTVSRAAAVLGVSTERLMDILTRASIAGDNVLEVEFATFFALLERELMVRPAVPRVKAALAILVSRSWADAQ